MLLVEELSFVFETPLASDLIDLLVKISKPPFSINLYNSAENTTTDVRYGMTSSVLWNLVFEYRMTRTRHVCWITTAKKLRYLAFIMLFMMDLCKLIVESFSVTKVNSKIKEVRKWTVSGPPQKNDRS